MMSGCPQIHTSENGLPSRIKLCLICLQLSMYPYNGQETAALLEPSWFPPSPPERSYHNFPSVVGAIYPARMVKSPNRSPSRRSKAYRVIIGRRIARISGSVTDSARKVKDRLNHELEGSNANLDRSCSSVDHNNLHQGA
jgi:hypothetical protein